jgi:hypothetical protein
MQQQAAALWCWRSWDSMHLHVVAESGGPKCGTVVAYVAVLQCTIMYVHMLYSIQPSRHTCSEWLAAAGVQGSSSKLGVVLPAACAGLLPGSSALV